MMLIGIVGKPSSGKSTFLNAACMTDAKTANYPFTTIKPNIGESHIKIQCVCKELNLKDNPRNSYCNNGQRFIPIKLLDVAGLVPGAHEGKGMGNKFLSDLSRADALIHVIDISGALDSEGQDIEEGSWDPYRDVEFLEEEINQWFKNIIVKKDWQKFSRKIEQEKLSFADTLYERMAGLSIKKWHILQAIKSSNLDFAHLTKWSDANILHFASQLRKISKPIVIAANKIDKTSSESVLKTFLEQYKGKTFPCAALAEIWLRKFEEKKIIDYIPGNSNFQIIDEAGVTSKEKSALLNIQAKILTKYSSTGIQSLLNYIIFEILNQIVVYPVYDSNNFTDKDGNVLPDAFLVKKGTVLKDFVQEKIHSDLAKNFIYGLNARTKRRLGEDYELQHLDIIKIVSAA